MLQPHQTKALSKLEKAESAHAARYPQKRPGGKAPECRVNAVARRSRQPHACRHQFVIAPPRHLVSGRIVVNCHAEPPIMLRSPAFRQSDGKKVLSWVCVESEPTGGKNASLSGFISVSSKRHRLRRDCAVSSAALRRVSGGSCRLHVRDKEANRFIRPERGTSYDHRHFDLVQRPANGTRAELDGMRKETFFLQAINLAGLSKWLGVIRPLLHHPLLPEDRRCRRFLCIH